MQAKMSYTLDKHKASVTRCSDSQ